MAKHDDAIKDLHDAVKLEKAEAVTEEMDDMNNSNDSEAARNVSKKNGNGLHRTQSEEALTLSIAQQVALVIVLTGATFLNTFSVQAVVIVLPTIGRELNIPNARQQWVVSAYALTSACFLLLWGRLADVYGRRMIFLTGSLWVMITTIICPFMPEEISFDVVRGLQGLGAAANVPTAIGILGATFPSGTAKNYAISFYSAGFPIGSIMGNIVGGVVGEYTSWKWMFWILGILAALIAVAGYFLIPVDAATTSDESIKSAVDWLGGVLVTVGLMVLVFALTEGNVTGWSTPWIPVLIVVGVALVVLFVVWQWYLENRTTRRPLMRLEIWKSKRFAAAQLIMACTFGAFNNYLVFATFFYQDYLRLSVIQTTLRFIPTGVVGLCTCVVSSQILSRVDSIYIMAFGTTCVAVSCLLLAAPIPPSTSYWAYGLEAMAISVFGVDTVYPCLALFTMQSVAREDQALGGSIINGVAQLGRVFSLAIGTAIEIAVKGDDQPGGHQRLLRALRSAQWFSFAIGMVSACIAVVAFRGVGKVGAKKK